jgi:hypothetical protein
MNEQISLAYSVQLDGTASYALSVVPQDDPSASRSLNLSSLGGNPDDLAFIESVNKCISDYRAAKGF